MDFDFSRGQYRRIYSGCIWGRRINRVGHLAERLFWRLTGAVDDYGNHPWDPYLIRHQLVPLLTINPDELLAAMAELEKEGLVARYTHRGESFGHVCGHLALQPADRSGRRVRRYPPCPSERDDLAPDEPSREQPDPTPQPTSVDASEPCGTPATPAEPCGALGNPGEPCGTPRNSGDTTTTTTTKTTTKNSSSKQPPEQDQDNSAAAVSLETNSDGLTATDGPDPPKPGPPDIYAMTKDEFIEYTRLVSVLTPEEANLAHALGLTNRFVRRVLGRFGLGRVWWAIAECWREAQKRPIPHPEGFIDELLVRGAPPSPLPGPGSPPPAPPPAVAELVAGITPLRVGGATGSQIVADLGLTIPFLADTLKAHGVDRVARAIERCWLQSRTAQIVNPSGFILHLLKSGHSPPTAPPKSSRERDVESRATVRRAVEAARQSACRGLGLPEPFKPASRSRWPQVSTADADRVAAAMAEAAKKARSDLATQAPGPPTSGDQGSVS